MNADRIQSVDWLRGGAVAVMVAAHSLAFLSPAHDDDPIRANLNVINGLPAPAFLFAAGFSLALVTARGERTGPPKRARPVWNSRPSRSLRRVGVVFLASLLLRHVQWDAFNHLDRFAWVDVLSCIALMLVATWVVLFALPNRTRVASLAGLSTIAIVAAPWVESPRTFGWATTLVNNAREPNTWPLVPWAAYGWLGAIVGLRAAASDAPRRALFDALAWLAIVGVALLVAAGPVVRAIDPRVGAWIIANLGDRLWRIAVVTMAMLMIEARRHGPAGRVERWLNLLSRQALVAYCGHQVLLFGWSWFRPFNRFLYREDWPVTLALIVAMLAATTLACAIVDRRPITSTLARAWRTARRDPRSS